MAGHWRTSQRNPQNTPNNLAKYSPKGAKFMSIPETESGDTLLVDVRVNCVLMLCLTVKNGAWLRCCMTIETVLGWQFTIPLLAFTKFSHTTSSAPSAVNSCSASGESITRSSSESNGSDRLLLSGKTWKIRSVKLSHDNPQVVNE